MIEWSAADIPDLSGRVAVVTGANSGIGLETTRELALAGASVIMASRSLDRGQAAKQQLVDEAGSTGRTIDDHAVTVLELDLGLPESRRRFADEVIAAGTIDLLINNAGVMACPPALGVEGVERQWTTNHLGHFALTGMLLPSLNDGGRVVSVSSLAAEGGDLSGPIPTDLDDYSRFGVYSDTKLANQVFAVELNHRLAAAGSRSISVAAHPGISHTNLGAGIAVPIVTGMLKGLSRLLTQSAADGALPILRAATDPAVEGGQYYGPAGRKQHRGPPKQLPLVNGASRRSLGRKLWDESMDLTDMRYLAGR